MNRTGKIGIAGMAGLIGSFIFPQPVMAGPTETRATILYDNNRFNPGLETAWGFSCLIEGFEKTILFDTGGDGYTLLNNMRRLEVEPAVIDILVLSHIHGDHTGGLGGFLEQNPHVVVYLPGSFPEDFKQSVMSVADGVEEVLGAREICPGGLLDRGARGRHKGAGAGPEDTGRSGGYNRLRPSRHCQYRPESERGYRRK